MARTLKDFIGRHRGETAWLFGKGPSLDRFDMAAAGPLRCAINDVVKEVPGCLYAFANDSVRDWVDVYQPGHVLFTPHRTLRNEFLQPVLPACDVVPFFDDHEDERLAWSPAAVAEHGLAIRRGTLGSAGQILALMGVRRIVCVGIDGGGSHANRQWRTRLRVDHAGDYNAIREAFMVACRIQGIAVEFFGTPATEPLNGMKYIKIIEATFMRGVALSAGEIIEALPTYADELVANGRARYWQPPAKLAPVLTPVEEAEGLEPAESLVETAQAAPAAETAAARPRRGRRDRAPAEAAQAPAP